MGNVCLVLVLVGALLFGCKRPQPDARPEPTTAVSSPAPPASAPPPASARFEPPPDPELLAFYERMQVSCHLPESPASTAEMVGHARGLERCALARAKQQVARLPAARATRLRSALGATSQGAHWLPAWDTFSTDACNVADALLWTSGDFRFSGTMRRTTWASCFSGAAVEQLYWLEAFARGDASSMARHLLLQAPVGQHAERLQGLLAREADYFATSAPETPAPQDGCDLCPLGDASFRRLAFQLRSVRGAAPNLAGGLCQAWPELEREIGDKAACQELVRLNLLRAADGWGEYYDDLLQGGPRRELGERELAPPAKDRDYAAFINPVYEECERKSDHPDEVTPALLACFEHTRQAELTTSRLAPASLAAVDGGWRAFRTELCAVEEEVAPFTKNRLFGRKECELLASARASFLLHAWENDATGAFRRHALHRKAWSARVESGLELAHRVTPRAPRIRHAAHRLAATLCGAWPSMARASDDCAAEVELYLLSQSHSLGMMWTASEIDEKLRDSAVGR